jgi:hypothetical protein
LLSLSPSSFVKDRASDPQQLSKACATSQTSDEVIVIDQFRAAYTKCKMMHPGRSRQRHSYTFNYSARSQEIIGLPIHVRSPILPIANAILHIANSKPLPNPDSWISSLMVATLRQQAIPYSSGLQQDEPHYHLVLLIK